MTLHLMGRAAAAAAAVLIGVMTAIGGQAATAAALETGNPPDLEKVITALETRYGGPGFSVVFEQRSILKALDIVDRADGRLYVRRPDRMRWEYDSPEAQTIVSDGKTLWIYRPADYQVMIGKAPDFFGDGKGAGFLSDMKLLRRKFDITLEGRDGEGRIVLKLVPKEKLADIASIHLHVSPQTDLVTEIVTVNFYGDETRISLDAYQFSPAPDESLFHFEIPPGVDVIELD